ncbi:hypothetical protein [Aeoliella sp.]|uniref:hypothetical protein n=1 Tax=Aeoliella sp. TaxID=2795800 RepID=UPI003CCC181C
MIESFVNDLAMGLALIGFAIFGVVYVVGVLLYLLARHCHRDYKKQGGAKVVVPKVVGGTAAKIVGNALRKRFLG